MVAIKRRVVFIKCSKTIFIILIWNVCVIFAEKIESHPALHSVIATLSTGPVGPSDAHRQI